MPAPAGLVVADCVTAIVNRSISGLNVSTETQNLLTDTWTKVIDELFTYILANLKVTVTIPQIPSNAFTLTLAGSITIADTPYAVSFSQKDVSAVTVPAPSVALL
jgi:hypothetical protein